MLPYALILKIQDSYCKEDWPIPVAVKVYTMGLFVFQYALPLLIITFAYAMVAKKLRDQAVRIAKNREASGISSPAYNRVREGYLLQATSEGYSVSSPTIPRFAENRITSDPTKQELVQTSLDPGTSDRKEVKRLERNTKIIKMLVTVVAFYAICLLPNQVVWLWIEFGSGQSWSYINGLLTFGSIMVYVNSCVNPLLYAGMNEEFRKGFMKLLHCRWISPAQTRV